MSAEGSCSFPKAFIPALLSFCQERATVPCFIIGEAASAETHPQDPIEVFLVYSEEVTVVFSQDNGGSSGGVVDKSQLPKVVSFVKRANNTLSTANWSATDTWQHNQNDAFTVCMTSSGGILTFPQMTTLTEPFKIMYHDVPSSPWLNTETEKKQKLC